MENVFYKACAENPYMPIPYSGNVLLLNSKNWEKEYAPKLRAYYKGKVKKNDVKTSHAEWFKPKQIKMIIKEIEENIR